MATATPDLQQMPGMTPPAQKQDASPDNPVAGKPEDRLDQNGLRKLDRDNLLLIRRKYIERWAPKRRAIVRNVLRAMEYLKGNQYYVFEPGGFSFYDPFSKPQEGTQQGQDDQDIYHYVTNILQWFERVFVASLGVTLPATRFQPTDAQSDLGNRVAQNASRANAYIERLNDAKALLKQVLSNLALGGVSFRYSRWLRDARLSGGGPEVVPQEEMQDQQVAGDHYVCKQCGAEVPAEEASSNGMQCPTCGYPLTDADFYPSTTLPLPVQTGMKEAAKGRVAQSIYNALAVNADPDADSESGDALLKTALLDLSLETDIATMRAMFPDSWNDFASMGDPSGAGDGGMDRQARQQVLTQTTQNFGMLRSGGLANQDQMPTYSRTWIQPEAFNLLDKKEDAQALQKLFPEGCCVASSNGTFLDVRPAILTEEWTSARTRAGFGLYPPAALNPAMDFQDRINDTANTQQEYYDRMAVPAIAYNPKAISGKGFSGKYWPVGSWFPVPVKPELKLSDAIFQPQFHKDNSIAEYQRDLLMTAQLIIGVTPQMYGGHQEGVDTKGGQEQALRVATGIMWLYWDAVRAESSRAAKNSVKCLADNATEDVFDVVKGAEGRFKNEPIDLDTLKNEIDAYPEADQGYPISYEQQRNIWQELIEEGAQNPIIMEMLEPIENRRMAARALLPQDVIVVGASPHTKVLEDIALMVKGQPTSGPDPLSGQMVPLPGGPFGPVVPDKEFDDFDMLVQTVDKYVQDNYRQLSQETPLVLQNIRIYKVIAESLKRAKELMSAPPAAPGAPAGPAQQ